MILSRSVALGFNLLFWVDQKKTYYSGEFGDIKTNKLTHIGSKINRLWNVLFRK